MKKLIVIALCAVFPIVGAATTPAPVSQYDQAKKLVVQHPEIIKQYPQLVQEIFGTTDIKELSQEHVWNTTKNLITEGKEWGKIVAASTLAAILYGIAHDLVTARICVEYFSAGFHKQQSDAWANIPVLKNLKSMLDAERNENERQIKIAYDHDVAHNLTGANKTVPSVSSTTHALVWGTVATWWMGTGCGIALAATARAGNWPKLTVKELVKPGACVLGATAFSYMVAAIWANHYFTDSSNADGVHMKRMCDWNTAHDNMLRLGVNRGNEVGFITNCYVHQTACAVAALGTLACMGYLAHKRYKKQQVQDKKVTELLAAIKTK